MMLPHCFTLIITTKFTYFYTFLNAPFACRDTWRSLRHHFAEKCGKPVALRITPDLNAISFLLCFPLGIYVMQERKRVMDFKTRELLSKLHMFFQVVAMLLLSLGGAAAYMTKNAFGKEHFTSTHSWLAAGTATLATLSLLGVS
ncbi:hypothetical protein PsorP6_001701 [Peronosclerospora sorghi]|uniref:Uncharacterized protein n=1 Tax=Peronosclerospora sorghi TaxID=230839 RepID=A0ACC0WUM6_9STRA|nr:hypothetical protein PsorP6_001701 [Peronosclerospora sorghi]